MGVPASRAWGWPRPEVGGGPTAWFSKPRRRPTAPEDSPHERAGGGGRRRRGAGGGGGRGRGARVGTPPACKSPGGRVARDPRPGRPRGPASEPAVAARWQPRPAGPSSSDAPYPPPTRSGCGPRGLGPDPPVSRVPPSVPQGTRGVRLLRSLHVFLCLSFPACDCLQLPCVWGHRVLPALPSCRPRSDRGAGMARARPGHGKGSGDLRD